MPAYWSLGFHLSRWGYGSIDVLKKTVDRMHYHDIPYVSMDFSLCMLILKSKVRRIKL